MHKYYTLLLTIMIFTQCNQAERIQEIKTSSKPVSSKLDRFSYDKYNLIDQKLSTSWQVRNSNSGIGEWVELRFLTEQSIESISIFNGFQYIDSEFGDLYYLNSRLKSVEVCVNGHACKNITLPDTKDAINIPINETGIKNIRIRFLDTYRGSKWTEDIAVSEIRINYRKPPILYAAIALGILLAITAVLRRKKLWYLYLRFKNGSKFNQETYDQGKAFETLIAGMLNKSPGFQIESWNNDIHLKHKGIFVNDDTKPDFTITHKPSKTKLYVECKYRAKTYQNSKGIEVIKWATKQQISRYNTISERDEFRTFILIGMGGKPEKPESIFCIPLSEAKYPELFMTLLAKYKLSPKNHQFTYEHNMLL